MWSEVTIGLRFAERWSFDNFIGGHDHLLE